MKIDVRCYLLEIESSRVLKGLELIFKEGIEPKENVRKVNYLKFRYSIQWILTDISIFTGHALYRRHVLSFMGLL